MKQPYFVVVLAHSLHGRLRRIHIPQSAIYAVVVLAVLGCISLFGFVSSYARMAGKVANYNSLRREAQSIRQRYDNLQQANDQTKMDLATLQLFASQVSAAYGIKQKLEGPPDITGEGKLVPDHDRDAGAVQLPEEREHLEVLSHLSAIVAAECPSEPVAG